MNLDAVSLNSSNSFLNELKAGHWIASSSDRHQLLSYRLGRKSLNLLKRLSLNLWWRWLLDQRWLLSPNLEASLNRHWAVACWLLRLLVDLNWWWLVADQWLHHSAQTVRSHSRSSMTAGVAERQVEPCYLD